MKPALPNLIISFWLLSVSFICHANDISGIWAQIDEKDNHMNSLIKIDTHNGELTGTIIKGFPKPGKTISELDPLCRACPGDLKNQPLIGMRIIWDMKGSANNWEGGYILDADIGEIYRLSLTLADDNQSLKVRGYVGIELFGRTQTWQRYTGKID